MSDTKRLKLFGRYLTIWVGLCMVAGVLMGKAFPGVTGALRGLEFGTGSQINLPIAMFIWLMRLFQVDHRVAAPGALIGASNFFELAVATSIALFGAGSGAALATAVGVLIEVQVMLSICAVCNRRRHWFLSSAPALANGARAKLSAPVRNYGDVLLRASGRGSKPFVFDFRHECGQIFASEGPLKGRSGFLVAPLKC